MKCCWEGTGTVLGLIWYVMVTKNAYVKYIAGYEPVSLCESEGGKVSIRQCGPDRYQEESHISTDMKYCDKMESCDRGL
jgi:hypothetical protein